MDKTFDPRRVEAQWCQTWEADGCYQAGSNGPNGTGKPYSIMIPPPNVTGTLHMGHAFQHTVMDALTRYHRMAGDDTLWQPGTDHAGIATQMVVERNLKLAGEPSRAELGRDKFLDKVWEWKKYSAGTISQQIRRMGSSVDWSREAFTMDPSYSKAVVEHFVRLHEDGLIYRGKRLVNWDPVLQTAISDLEVVQEEENGKLWHFRYPLADGVTYLDAEGRTLNYIVVATTRPETMLGDTAVAVHPEDERYRHLVGKDVWLPLCNRRIPIVADDYVDREFGTGCVKITPAHDFNDYQLGQRHQLPLINILTRTASLNDAVPERYRGLDRVVARKQVVADLESDTTYPDCHSGESPGQLSGPGAPNAALDPGLRRDDEGGEGGAEAAKSEKPAKPVYPRGLVDKIVDHKLKVPRGDRSGAVLEPYLTDQWFVDLTRDTRHDGQPGKGGRAAITQPAIDAVESGRIRFVPDNWKTTYFHWLNNIQDWCISRQLWWGHRIPAWYDEAGRVYVGRDEAEVRAKHGLAASVSLKQDEDVFDTWFSSDIWPMATLGWPDNTEALNKYYPSSVLVTGFDIIFFWVARMVMMGQYFMNDVPFRDVFITGLVRDPEGNKMSKSKGNVLDPLDVVDGITLDALVAKRTTGLMNPATAPKIEAKTRKDYPKGIEAVGVDALRFTFAALATNGRDVRFDAARAEGYRNFCNKIWNASRFVLINVGALDAETGEAKSAVSLDGEVSLSTADRWIISRLQKLEAEAAGHFEAYRFDLLAASLYQFIWNEYCDWYLELTKPVMQGNDELAKRGARRTLVRVLEVWLRLLHPIMPFITEEIWQKVAPIAGKAGRTIMLEPYPIANPERIDEAAEADVEWLKGFMLGVRQIRGEMDIPPGKPLPVLIQNAEPADAERIARFESALSFLARLESIRVLGASDDAPQSAIALLVNMKILVPMAGLIDKAAELARLAKLKAKLENDLKMNEARLASDKFVNGAPAAVIDKERARVAQQKAELAMLSDQERRISAL